MAVSSPDLKAFLVATPFFGGLSDASLDLLISMLVERRFDVGATVVAEGEPGSSMYIVHSGELLVEQGRECGCAIRMTGSGLVILWRNDAHRNAVLISHRRRWTAQPCCTSSRPENLYTYYKADIYAYVMVMQISRACRRLRRADNRIAELADASRDTTQYCARPVG